MYLFIIEVYSLIAVYSIAVGMPIANYNISPEKIREVKKGGSK